MSGYMTGFDFPFKRFVCQKQQFFALTSLTFDLDWVLTELWLPNNFVSAVSLCDSGTHLPLSVVFAPAAETVPAIQSALLFCGVVKFSGDC